MDTYKLKIKIGEHEFEAEGPVEVVQAQFTAFRELIATIPAAAATPAPNVIPTVSPELPHLPIEKILKVEGRMVSLTAKCETIDEAVLLVLLGQKDLRNNQEVTGAEIMDGLKQSGYMLGRVDKVLDRLSANGNVHTIGFRRGRRYRLTNLGVNAALEIAKEVLSTVP